MIGVLFFLFVIIVSVSFYTVLPVYVNIPGVGGDGVGVPINSHSDAVGEQHHPDASIEPEIIHNPNNNATYVEYTVTFRDVDSFRFSATPGYQYEVKETRGMIERNSGYVAVDSNPVFVLRDNVSAYGSHNNNPRAMATESWVFTPVPDIRYGWVNSASYYSSTTTSHTEHVSFESDTYDTHATEDMVVISEDSDVVVDAETVSNTTIELVYLEDDYAERFDAEKVMYELQRTEELLQVDANNERVTMFAAPSDGAITGGIRYGTDTPRTETLWSASANNAQMVHSTWVHEYVHANQKYDALGPEMQWFHEGSANYFAMVIPHRVMPDREPSRTEFSLRSHREIMNNTANEPVLADRSTWNEQTDYDRGMVVLFELDYRMRMYSDGEYDMRDTLRWMNNQDGIITYEEWKQEIVSNTDDDMEHVIDEYVQGTRQVHLHEDKLPPQFDAYPEQNQTTTDWKHGFDTEFEYETRTYLTPTEERLIRGTNKNR